MPAFPQLQIQTCQAVKASPLPQPPPRVGRYTRVFILHQLLKSCTSPSKRKMLQMRKGLEDSRKKEKNHRDKRAPHIKNHIKVVRTVKRIPTYPLPRLCNYQHFGNLALLYGRSVNFFCEGSDSKYFELFDPYGPCHNYCTLLLQCESSHRLQTNEHICVPMNFIHKTSLSSPPTGNPLLISFFTGYSSS